MDAFSHLHPKETEGAAMSNEIPKTLMNHARQRFYHFLRANTTRSKPSPHLKSHSKKNAQKEIIIRRFVSAFPENLLVLHISTRL